MKKPERPQLAATAVRLTWLILCLLFLNGKQASVQASSAGTQTQQNAAARSTKSETIVSTEIRIVDDTGRTRLVLSARSGQPVVSMLGADGSVRLSVALDKADYGAVKITNPNLKGPVAALAVDDKGAHVKFDRPGGASSYLFLNNAGESGTVFMDANGRRRLNLLVMPDGQSQIVRFDEQQKPLP